MSLAKKSTLWLVAAIVVFALALTAVFAANPVTTTAKADTKITSYAVVEAYSETGTAPNLTEETAYPDLLEGTARTITAKYYFQVPANKKEAQFYLAPILTLPDNSTVRPSAIELNPALTAATMNASLKASYIAGAATHFEIEFFNADVPSGLDVDGTTYTTVSNGFLFTATFVIASDAAPGQYTFGLAANTEFSVESGATYYAPTMVSGGTAAKKGFFNIRKTVTIPVADAEAEPYVYDGSEKTFAFTTASLVDAAYINFANNVKTNAGSYTVTASLKDPAGTAWVGNTTADQTYTFTITKKQVTIPTAVANLVYTGSAQTGVTVDYTDYTKASGTIEETAAGDYSATFALNDTANTEWADAELGEEITNKTVEWSIGYLLVTKPTATTTTYYYSPNTEQTYTFASVGDSDKYTVANDKRTNAGTQTVTATLSNASYKWEDGTTADLEFTFTIKKLSVIAAACSLDNTFTYTGEEITCNFISEGQQSYFTITGHKQTNVGTYDVTETLNDPNNYKWSHFPNVSDDEPTAPYVQENAFQITKRSVAIPTAISGLVYTGEEQVGVTKTDGSFYTLYSGSEKGTDVGNYSATYRLKSTTNTYWADNTSDVANKTVNWSIGKAQITKPSISASFKIYNGESQSYSGSGTGYSFTGSGTNAGDYPVTVSLTDKNNTVWAGTDSAADYSEADKLIIAKKTVRLTLTKSADNSVYGDSIATITAGINPDYAPINTADIGTVSYTAKNFQTNVIYTKAEFETIHTAPVGNYILTAVCSVDNDNYSVEGQTLPYEITKRQIEIPVLEGETTTFGYDGSTHGISFTEASLVDAALITFTGTQSATSVGEYTYTASLPDTSNYLWSDSTTAAKNYDWSITVKQITKPTPLSGVQYVYDSYNKQFMLDVVSAETGYYTISNNIRKNAGTQTVTVSLNDKSNTQWADGTTTNLEFTFTVQRRPVNISVSAAAASHVYGNTPANVSISMTGAIDAFSCSYKVVCVDGEAPYAEYTPTQFNAGLNVGHYTLNPVYNDINGNYDVTVSEPFAYEITTRYITVPTVEDDTFGYDGNEHSIGFSNVDNDYVDITYDTQSDIGVYTDTTTVALKAAYAGNIAWDDEGHTTAAKTYTLTINVVNVSITFVGVYNDVQKVLAEDVEIAVFTDLPTYAIRWFRTDGFVFNNQIVTTATLAMDGATLTATYLYNVGAGDLDGDGYVTVIDVLEMKKSWVGLNESRVLADEDAAWSKCDDNTVTDPIFATSFDVNRSGEFHSSDVLAIREALATGYNFAIVVNPALSGVTGQAVVTTPERLTITTYNVDDGNGWSFVKAVAAGYPIALGADISAATADYAADVTVPVDINLNGHTLTVNSFTLHTDVEGITLKIWNSDTANDGSIFTVEGISITAPAGNVVVSGVSGYSYEGTTVTLAAASSSLHVESNVGFYQYKVEGKATAADYKETVTTDDAIDELALTPVTGVIATTQAKVELMNEKKEAVKANDQAKAAKQAEMAAVDSESEEYAALAEQYNALVTAGNTLSNDIDEIDVFKAPVSIPVDTHVVVEASANLAVEKVTVIEAKGADADASTFSINVKNTEAEVITVDISEVKDIIDEVNYYHVDEVALEGDTSKVEIITAEDQTVEQTFGVRTYAELAAALAEGGKITVAANISSSDGYIVTKDAEIDLNGYTITVQTGAKNQNNTSNNNRAFKILSDVNLEIYNGTIDALGASLNNGKKSCAEAGTGAYGAFRAEVGSTLNVHDITLKNYRPWGMNVKLLGATATLTNVNIVSSYGGGIEVSDDAGAAGTLQGYAVLTNCVMTQSNYHDWNSSLVSVSGASTVDVYSTTYTGEYGVYVFSSGGTINLYGGTFTALSQNVLQTSYGSNYGNDAIINVYDGAYYGTFGIGNSGHEFLNVYGGAFDHDPSAYLANENDEAVFENGMYYVAPATLVKTYDEMAAALAVGGKILVGANISSTNGYIVTEDAEIDLNGYTITVETGALNQNNTENKNRAFRIDNGATLTIYNGTIDTLGGGTNSSNGYGCYGGFRAEVETTLVAHDLTLKNYRPWGLNVKILGASATLTNVDIISSYGGGIEVTDDEGADGTVQGYAVMRDCTVTQSGHFDHCSTAVSVSGDSVLDVYSTDYTAEYGVYVFSSGGVVNIYGGTFTALSKNVLQTSYDAQYDNVATINVYDGTFYGTYGIGNSGHEVLNVYGGTFDHDPSAYVADGYAAGLNDDDMYVVIAAELEEGIATQAQARVSALNLVQYYNLSGVSKTNFTIAQLGIEAEDFYVNVGYVEDAVESISVGSATFTAGQTFSLSIGYSNFIRDLAFFQDDDGNVWVAAVMLVTELDPESKIAFNGIAFDFVGSAVTQLDTLQIGISGNRDYLETDGAKIDYFFSPTANSYTNNYMLIKIDGVQAGDMFISRKINPAGKHSYGLSAADPLLGGYGIGNYATPTDDYVLGYKAVFLASNGTVRGATETFTIVSHAFTNKITTFAELEAAITAVNEGTLENPSLYIANDIAFEHEIEIKKSVTIVGSGATKFIGYDASTKYDEAFYINVEDEDQEITIEGIVFDHFCYYSNVANKTKATASAVKNGVAYITYGGNCPASTCLTIKDCKFLGTARDMINASSTIGCKGFIVIEDCYFDATDRLSSTLNMLSFYGNADAELYVIITGCTFKEASEEDATWATSAIASFGNADLTITGCEFIACQIGIAIDNTFDRLFETSTYPVTYNTTVTYSDITYTNCYFGYYEESVFASVDDIPEGAELYTDEPFTYGDNAATQFHLAAEYDLTVAGTQGVDAKYLVVACYYVEAMTAVGGGEGAQGNPGLDD